jgi:acyl-CoA thioesterase
MKTFTVKILKNGQHVDTQTVRAENEGKAISVAMTRTKVRFMGALATYEVTE